MKTKFILDAKKTVLMISVSLCLAIPSHAAVFGVAGTFMGISDGGWVLSGTGAAIAIGNGFSPKRESPCD